MARRELRVVQVDRPFEYHSPFGGLDHTLLICALDRSVTADERASVSRQIVEAHCRYAVCWGDECSAWDTAIDSAYIATDKDFSPPDDTFVMTTWHEDEPIEDTIEFCWMNTNFDDYESTRFGVLLLGGDRVFHDKVVAITSEAKNHWNRQESEAKGDSRPT